MCRHCDVGGHPSAECPKRQRRYFGTPGDESEAMADRVEDENGGDA